MDLRADSAQTYTHKNTQRLCHASKATHRVTRIAWESDMVSKASVSVTMVSCLEFSFQACMNPDHFAIFHKFEANLTFATDARCPADRHLFGCSICHRQYTVGRSIPKKSRF